jgi:hypothetical protein
VVLEFAYAYQRRIFTKRQILQSLTPLYLARVASFIGDTEDLIASEVEEKIEHLCLTFEALKPWLVKRWNGEPGAGAAPPAKTTTQGATNEASLEV